MQIRKVFELRKGEVFDFTPWCEPGVTATAVIVQVKELEPGRSSVDATMLAIDGATQDEWGIPWSSTKVWMPLDSDQEIMVL